MAPSTVYVWRGSWEAATGQYTGRCLQHFVCVEEVMERGVDREQHIGRCLLALCLCGRGHGEFKGASIPVDVS